MSATTKSVELTCPELDLLICAMHERVNRGYHILDILMDYGNEKAATEKVADIEQCRVLLTKLLTFREGMHD